MSLVALALGVDAAFVSTHHIVRIVLIVSPAPLTFRAFRRFERRRHPESGRHPEALTTGSANYRGGLDVIVA